MRGQEKSEYRDAQCAIVMVEMEKNDERIANLNPILVASCEQFYFLKLFSKIPPSIGCKSLKNNVSLVPGGGKSTSVLKKCGRPTTRFSVCALLS